MSPSLSSVSILVLSGIVALVRGDRFSQFVINDLISEGTKFCTYEDSLVISGRTHPLLKSSLDDYNLYIGDIEIKQY